MIIDKGEHNLSRIETIEDQLEDDKMKEGINFLSTATEERKRASDRTTISIISNLSHERLDDMTPPSGPGHDLTKCLRYKKSPNTNAVSSSW